MVPRKRYTQKNGHGHGHGPSHKQMTKELHHILRNNGNNSENIIYSEDDYNSNDGMLTTVWGPSMWHCLHTISFNYPVHPSESDKKHYREFILNLEYVLPCGKCRKNLRKNFKKLPLEAKDMESRATFSKYIYDLHEVINTMLKKKSGLSYADVRERYEHFRSRCTKSPKNIKKKTLKMVKKKKHVRFAKPLSVTEEKGCTEPLYGEKSKCVLQIVPQEKKCESFQMDKNCIKKRGESI
uniref:thiol oxidase n=1 Tax=viral metagenome TaxID=1070528 RepID=A0A6C0JGV8_9ZZZZ